jgi:hypothetical protein
VRGGAVGERLLRDGRIGQVIIELREIQISR